ncbi:MAG: hypothetical protein L0206_00990 [Actinobacteria bacterium]|nr:hypothetical protein [Actinomycetota bacterium]
MSTGERKKVRCDCCDEEVLAYDYGDRIVIEDHRHGRKHTATISLRPEARTVDERDRLTSR